MGDTEEAGLIGAAPRRMSSCQLSPCDSAPPKNASRFMRVMTIGAMALTVIPVPRAS